MPAIDIIDSAGNDYRYELPVDGSALLIGTGEDCSISLPHITDLQPQHCTITLQEEGYVISIVSPEASLLAEGQPTDSAILVPRAAYNIGSAMLVYDDGSTAAATTEEAPAEEAPAAAPAAEESTPKKKKAKKKKKKKAAGHAPVDGVISYTEEDSTLHIILRRLYVIFILAAAFLAGLTLRYWMITGEFLIDELLK
ncbi:MAG: hypothetical protein IKW48_06080 [Akkermansia sp.]|nr:hypothetical protein [Akkermansia sp.]